jgi:predicted Fe-S protein YdhL (DUF1289 family)
MRLQRIKHQAMSLLSRLQLRADQVLASDDPFVPSPCVSVCVVHPIEGVCEGCLRSLDEIGAWGQMQSAQQREVWQQIKLRSTKRLQTTKP